MSAEARVPPSATLPADLVERPRRVRQSYVGIVALSRWRGAADRSSAPSKARRASKTFSYRQLGGARTRRHASGRQALADEEEVRAEVEEQNRAKAATYVACDQWEEASTGVWFPVAPTLREAIQANSQALGSLTREAETRSALAA